jgi:hypothetical protein
MNGHVVVKAEICDPNRLVLQNGINNKSKETKENGVNGYRVHSSDQDLHSKPVHCEEFEATPLWIAVLTYMAYAILILFGYMRDLLRFYGLEKSRAYKERGNEVGSADNFTLLYKIYISLHTSDYS